MVHTIWAVALSLTAQSIGNDMANVAPLVTCAILLMIFFVIMKSVFDVLNVASYLILTGFPVKMD